MGNLLDSIVKGTLRVYGEIKAKSIKGTKITDDSGNELLNFTTNKSNAVNSLVIGNSATNEAPSINAKGTDSNIDINVITKGTGRLKENGTVVASSLDLNVVIAEGTAVAITLSIPTISSYVANRIITFVSSINNNGNATTININNLGAKNLYKPGGTVAPILIAGRAYTMWYSYENQCFFIKASAEGNTIAAHVLANDTFSNNIDTNIIGSLFPKMPNLIKDGNFAIGTLENWEANYYAAAVTLASSARSSMAPGAAQVTANNTRAYCGIARGGVFVPKLNHKYYSSAWYYVISYTSGTPCLRIRNTNPDTFYSANIDISKISMWQMQSVIFDTTGVADLTQWDAFILHDNGITTSTFSVFCQGMMILDLTDFFGAGNEPSKQQMDTIINSIGFWESPAVQLTGEGTVVAADMVSGKIAISKGRKIVGTLAEWNTDGNGYNNFNDIVNIAYSVSGRLHYPIKVGAYRFGADRGCPMGYIDDPDYVPSNILSTANIFGLQGGIQIGGNEEIEGWVRGNIGIAPMAGRVLLYIPNNKYYNGTGNKNQQGVFADDNNFVANNMICGKSYFGLPGAMAPKVHNYITSGWASHTTCVSGNYSAGTVNIGGGQSSSDVGHQYMQLPFQLIAGHKYYLRVGTTVNGSWFCSFGSHPYGSIFTAAATETAYIQIGSSGYSYMQNTGPDIYTYYYSSVSVSGIMLFDLTTSFGAGKEPNEATMEAIIAANGWWDNFT